MALCREPILKKELALKSASEGWQNTLKYNNTGDKKNLANFLQG